MLTTGIAWPTVSATPTADLQRHAAAQGVELSRTGAQRLLRTRGLEGAIDRVDAIADLVRTSVGLGRPLSTLASIRRLDAAGGDLEQAREQLVDVECTRRSAEFGRAWARFEQLLYSRDADQRHAVFVARALDAPLSWQSQVLLRAVRHAGLTAKEADGLDGKEQEKRLAHVVDGFRGRLQNVIDDEIARRYPRRPEADWRVLPADGERSYHDDLLDATIRDEQHARDLVLARVPELAQRLDRLATSPLARRRVHGVLADMRARIRDLADDAGWHPDPDRYRREVIDRARDAVAA